MKKKTLVLLAGLLVLVIAMAACGKKNDNGGDPETTPTETVQPTETPSPTDEPNEPGTDDGNGGTDGGDGSLDGEGGQFLGDDTAEVEKMYNAIVEKLGDDRAPSMALDAETVSELFGVKPEWYVGMMAESAMMSVHVDKLVIVKASEGHLEDVKTALNDYLASQQEDTMQYPMNLAKIQGGVVDSFDNYVIYSLLGSIEDETLEEDALIEAYKSFNNEIIETAKNAVAE